MGNCLSAVMQKKGMQGEGDQDDENVKVVRLRRGESHHNVIDEYSSPKNSEPGRAANKNGFPSRSNEKRKASDDKLPSQMDGGTSSPKKVAPVYARLAIEGNQNVDHSSLVQGNGHNENVEEFDLNDISGIIDKDIHEQVFS